MMVYNQTRRLSACGAIRCHCTALSCTHTRPRISQTNQTALRPYSIPASQSFSTLTITPPKSLQVLANSPQLIVAKFHGLDVYDVHSCSHESVYKGSRFE